MHNVPTVQDSLWFDNLPTPDRERLSRLFNINAKANGDAADLSYVRGYKAGVNVGHIEMLKEVQACVLCAEYGVRKCMKHKKQ